MIVRPVAPRGTGTVTRPGLVVVSGVQAELGLHGAVVDVVAVEAAFDLHGKAHPTLHAFCALEVKVELHVERGDELGARERPHVDVVAASDARERLDVLADVLDVDVFGRGLQEGTGGVTD